MKEPELGESIGTRELNPLDLVKRTPPLLSEDKRRAPQRALGALEEAAARDETCVWQRVRPLHPAEFLGTSHLPYALCSKRLS